VVVDINEPTKPRIVGELTGDFLRHPRAVGVQWRYAFVTDEEGLKVIDITEPTKPRPVPAGVVKLADARRFYLARTYAYVANGREGLAIIDIENPERPKLGQMFNAGGELNDTRAVQIGSVNASMFALVADGKNGFRVLQLISPDTVPGSMGFSPRPNPQLIATYHTHGEALAVSRGLDRDRVVDESGNQTVVFGRRGSRPFHLDEMASFFRHGEKHTGEIYRVEDVAMRADQLATRSGRELTPTATFQSPAEEQLPQPQVGRLMRRGK
jgi:LVIVD repeat